MSVRTALYGLYNPSLLKHKIPASEVGANFAPTLFIPFDPRLLPLMFGFMEYANNREYFTGTEQEIADALDVIQEQLGVTPLTQQEVCGSSSNWGIDLRFSGDQIQTRQGEPYPPPPYTVEANENSEGGIEIRYKTVESDVNDE